jgi:hypothetical protein
MLKASTCVAALFVAGLISLACSSSGLKARGSSASGGGGGQAGSTIGSGTTGGTGGTIGTGGAWGVSSGGAGEFGGAGAAGASGNTGGTDGCSRIDCHMPACAGEFQPNPDPCGCAVICVLTPDAGVAKDAGGPDFPAYCELVDCPIERPCSSGYARSTDPCGCPICAPVDGGTVVDGGKPDGPPPCRIACPMLVDCVGGYLPNPDPCTCPICAPNSDAGVANDAGGPDTPPTCPPVVCSALTCPVCPPISRVDSGTATDGGKTDTPLVCNVLCPVLACVGGYLPNPEPCGCPICATNPDAGTTCADAKARVAALCPTISGPTFDGLCTWPAIECVTQCLAEVSSCSDVGCTFCEACDCAGDRFFTCYQQCASTFGH